MHINSNEISTKNLVAMDEVTHKFIYMLKPNYPTQSNFDFLQCLELLGFNNAFCPNGKNGSFGLN